MAATRRRDSFSILRETMRWRVALVLGVLITVLMVALGTLNTSLGYTDTAWLAGGIFLASGACVIGLLTLPRQLGATIFFSVIGTVLVVVIPFGAMHEKPMQHWAYIFPPLLVFLLGSGRALTGMVLYGLYTCAFLVQQVAPIDVVRFASGYGLLVCFIYTYALLQERAGALLRFHSDHDALTNCLNRRTFNEAIDQLADNAGPASRCTFLLIDIDHFKAINDEHGHLVGDRIITETAAELGRILDPGVALFRYGGEEFAVILYDTGVQQGVVLGERLRAAVATADFRDVMVSVSIGVAEWNASTGRIEGAVGAADRALYDAKRQGRNRVVAHAPASSASR